jgi:RNase H-fold protein (predicted Holliday junction resolvase)
VSEVIREIVRVLAIDPGRGKCGIAVVQADGQVLHQAVLPAAQVAPEVARLVQEHRVTRLLLGDRTAAREIAAALRQAKLPLEPTIVDEHRSTEEGRRRYFRENPPRGWRRLLPVSLQTPPRAYDDYVAIILAQRYLKTTRTR